MISVFSTLPMLLGVIVLAWRLRRLTPRLSFWLLSASGLFLFALVLGPAVDIYLARTQTVTNYGRYQFWLQIVTSLAKCVGGLSVLLVALRWKPESSTGPPASSTQWDPDADSGTSASNSPYQVPK